MSNKSEINTDLVSVGVAIANSLHHPVINYHSNALQS